MKPPIKIWRNIWDKMGKDFVDVSNYEIPTGPLCRRSDEYILTAAIKDLPPDKLAELGVMRIPPPPVQCEAVVHHGAGHQSKTKCQIKHEHTTHYARYGEFDMTIEWEGDETFD